MLQFTQPKNRQRGITLIEVILGIAISSLVVLGVLAIYNNAQARADNDRELRNVQALLTEVRSMYTGRGTYGTADITAAMINSRAIPESMLQTAGTPPVTTVRHSWDGVVSVQGAGANFRILYDAVPSAGCTRLAPSLLSAFQSVEIGTAVAAGAVTGATAITNATADPVGAIATACGAAGTRGIAFVAR